MLKTFRVSQHVMANASKKQPPMSYWKGSESHSIYADKRRVLVDKIHTPEPTPLTTEMFIDKRKGKEAIEGR